MEDLIDHIRWLLMKVCHKFGWCDDCPIHEQCFAISADKKPSDMDDAEIKTLISLVGRQN